MIDGKLIIFSAPSGAGKTTLVRHLLSKKSDLLEFSISCTTRDKRVGEIDGKDYYFLSPEEFRKKIENDEFAEWEEVYKDHYYGTLKSEIERIWQLGKHVLFDIDVVGGLNLKSQFGAQALAIFVQPPSLAVLANRLKARNTDSEDKLEMRINKAVDELAFAHKFDVIIVNDDLDHAQEEAMQIISDFIYS